MLGRLADVEKMRPQYGPISSALCGPNPATDKFPGATEMSPLSTDPVKIVGQLYFVGTKGLSSWLFVTSEGKILLDTGTPNSGPMIVESIRKLGFKPEDIKSGRRWEGVQSRISRWWRL